MLPTNSITSINFKGIIQIRAFINDYYYTYKRFSIANIVNNIKCNSEMHDNFSHYIKFLIQGIVIPRQILINIIGHTYVIIYY